jgi:death on curing protein
LPDAISFTNRGADSAHTGRFGHRWRNWRSRSRCSFESAIAQPRATFGGEDLYQDILSKAATLGFGLIANHPFVDGNKRIGHAAMAVFLMLNGYHVRSTVDDQEAIILEVASGTLDQADFENWLRNHTTTH